MARHGGEGGVERLAHAGEGGLGIEFGAPVGPLQLEGGGRQVAIDAPHVMSAVVRSYIRSDSQAIALLNERERPTTAGAP